MTHTVPQPQQNPTPPQPQQVQTIMLDGQAVPLDQAQAYLNSQRQVEKNRMYDTVNNLRSQLATNQQVQPPQSPQPQNHNQTQPQQGVETVPTVQQIPAANQNLDQIVASKVNDILQATVAPLTQTLQSVQHQQIENYRQQKISEYGDQIIPEMIMGGTPQEIDASVEASKMARARYNNAQPQQPQQGVQPTAQPTQQAVAQPQQPQQPSVAQMYQTPQAQAPYPPVQSVVTTPTENQLIAPGMRGDSPEYANVREAALASVRAQMSANYGG
ncbi:hypothetical protein [Flammeovirga agarivorans]|uniref:Uncharacterized protein n=1 Tax=Flammeovirga agarivorans TaxID=2726742 RepID=A0A7X8SR77_9BACT|nr:hypothetical protein [Flammeovirga agarivorans]NLR94885.1 hypothetical protein [Flammeovirga agarivorans]